MREKPTIAEEAIIARAREDYALPITAVEFLPLGNDTRTWVYRVTTEDGQTYFLKLRAGPPYAPALLVPHALKDGGIEQVVAPLPAATGALWATLEPFTTILYPFVEGRSGMEVGLSEQQWVEFGATLRSIHAFQLPPALASQVRRETFVPALTDNIRAIGVKVSGDEFDDPYQREVAAFWKPRHEQIARIVARAEALGRALQDRQPPFVLCHSDIHTANVLAVQDGSVAIVDWDLPIFAPKERDLMYIVGNEVGSVAVSAGERAHFFSGYGPAEIDSLALAYYRYEWCVQDIAEFGGCVVLVPETGDITKREAVDGLQGMFLPGGAVDAAYQWDTAGPLAP